MFLFLFTSVIAITYADPASDLLLNYKNRTLGPIGILTTSNGDPVEALDTDTLNSNLINNELFMETLRHFARERVPERVVHSKGAGAFGYFEVTHNATDICKAKLFGEVGKRTPVAVRFSPTIKDKGEPDTSRDVRGFAVKFFTEEGNFDIAGLNTPIFFIKDPIMFPSIIRAGKRNPQTNLKQPEAFWDILSLRPETLFFFIYLFSDYGVPDGFRHMPGFSIHTYQVYNKCGDSYFVRFHYISEQGNKNILRDDAAKMAALDPDYAVRDLFNAIARCDFPSWTVSVQVLSREDVRRAKFDPFDTTKLLPLKQYPLRPLGRLVLNKNPINFFAEIEQLAFCPGNLVPGILGAPDKLFEARRFSYKDAESYRLGANFNKIRLNCPFTTVFSYDRDGRAPVGSNGDEGPNYFPNSYHGPIPYVDRKRPPLFRVKHDRSYNFDQVSEFYTNDLTEDERGRLIKNIVDSLKLADLFVQRRIVGIFEMIHPDLGKRIVAGLIKSENEHARDFCLNDW